jgi:hypothetical protein
MNMAIEFIRLLSDSEVMSVLHGTNTRLMDVQATLT